MFHLNCFKCLVRGQKRCIFPTTHPAFQDCGDVVASKFFPIDGPDGKQQPLCERDYFRRLNLICAKCGMALRGSYITACSESCHRSLYPFLSHTQTRNITSSTSLARSAQLFSALKTRIMSTTATCIVIFITPHDLRPNVLVVRLPSSNSSLRSIGICVTSAGILNVT